MQKLLPISSTLVVLVSCSTMALACNTTATTSAPTNSPGESWTTVATSATGGPYQTEGVLGRHSAKVSAELLSLKRESGTLMMKVVMTNQGDDTVNIRRSLWESYIVDPGSKRKAEPLQDTGYNRLVSSGDLRIPPGQKREFWAQYPEPPARINKVNVYLGGFPPIMNVPISQ